MNCREYQNQIVLFLYEELPEDDRNGLESHLHQCDGCRQTLNEQQGMHALLSEDAAAREFPSDLLVESRRSLADALDRVERKRSWWRVPAFSVVFTPMRLLESATLIAMGLALGVYVSQHQVAPSTSPLSAFDSGTGTISVIPQNGTVSNLRIVSTDPSGSVEFAGDVVQPLRFQGRMEEETTLRLLFSALLDDANPASRLQALEVLSKNSSEPSVKEVLIQALVNDENAGVRLRAIEGLKPFAGEEDVRTAFIQALKYDSNSGVRVSAIEALTPFISNDEIVNQIQEVTKNDDNAYVRMKGQGLQLVGNRR
jgi:hypothetical protein